MALEQIGLATEVLLKLEAALTGDLFSICERRPRRHSVGGEPPRSRSRIEQLRLGLDQTMVTELDCLNMM